MSAPRPRWPLVVTMLSALVTAVAIAAVVFAPELADRLEPEPEPTTQATDPVGVVGMCGTVPTQATRELRGMWLTTVNNIDWPSRGGLDEATVRAEYLDWLDVAQRFNHNAIFVHVRPSGDAFWPSEYAPWSQWLTGRLDGADPGWDPMEFMVAEAHARGLEFHAWFNPYRGAQPANVGGPGADPTKLAPGHPLREHPEWAVVYPVGDAQRGRFYFNPGVPEARHYVQDAILEAVERYDIDGVHFDDYFYPYPENGQDFADDETFATYGQGFADKADWRRDNVNTFVREMDERIKALKPWVKFGISPFGIWRNGTANGGADTRGLEAYSQLYADTRTWVEQGWLDYIVPQLYWYIGFEVADYGKLLPWWAEVVKGTDVALYIGQADYRVGEAGAWSDPAELSRHLAMGREYGVGGNVHYNSTSVRADRLGAQTRYRDEFYAAPALVPTMSQLPANPPAAPAVSATESGDTVTLTWPASAGAAHYAVYRVDGDVANLVATTASGSFTGPAGEYCVSALDRSWNEGPVSAPL